MSSCWQSMIEELRMMLIQSVGGRMRGPRIELRWRTIPVDENLLTDHILDKEPILFDFLHIFGIARILEVLTPFFDLLKYPSWGGYDDLDQEVFLARGGKVTLVECTLHFADTHHLPLLRL